MQPLYGEDLKVGDRIAGRYEILALTGKGSMGVVYKAKHDILGRVVAIKMLQVQSMTDERNKARFEREARAAERLSHPNLISVIDFGYTAEEIPYLIMDYVSGVSLYDILKSQNHLSPERVVKLYAQVCDAISHAHQRGVIHRDLKPGNILITGAGSDLETVKIVDLGIAKMFQENDDDSPAITRTGEVCGSPIYLSPEQCMYLSLGPGTDIYSLGVCLYESLTGKPPLRGETVYDTIYMQVHETPKPFSLVAPQLKLPSQLEAVVFRCLAKDPKDRYETMEEVKQNLLAALASFKTSSVHVMSPDKLFLGAQRSSLPKVEKPVLKPASRPAGFSPSMRKTIEKTGLATTSMLSSSFALLTVASIAVGLFAYATWQNERIRVLEASSVKPQISNQSKSSSAHSLKRKRVLSAGKFALAKINKTKIANANNQLSLGKAAKKAKLQTIKRPTLASVELKPRKLDGSAATVFSAMEMQKNIQLANSQAIVPSSNNIEPELTTLQLIEQGRTAALSQNFSLASAKFRLAHKMDPTNQYFNSCLAHALTSEAVSLNKKGNYMQAAIRQKEALELFPSNQLYQENLQRFQSNAQNLSEAR